MARALTIPPSPELGSAAVGLAVGWAPELRGGAELGSAAVGLAVVWAPELRVGAELGSAAVGLAVGWAPELRGGAELGGGRVRAAGWCRTVSGDDLDRYAEGQALHQLLDVVVAHADAPG